MRSQYHLNFAKYKTKVETFVANFNISGKDFVIGNRNSIKLFELDDLTLSIKSFKEPNFINKIAYKYFRKSKARRSFEYASKLIDLKIGTPKPVAFFENYDFMGLTDSYYACEHLENVFEFGPVLEIEVALLLRGDHVTDIVDLLLLQVVERRFRSLAVSLLRKHALAVHLLDHAHRHHTGAEARNIGLAFVLTQGFFDRIAVILLAYGHLDERVILLALFSYDIHISVVLYVTVRVGKSTK